MPSRPRGATAVRCTVCSCGSPSRTVRGTNHLRSSTMPNCRRSSSGREWALCSSAPCRVHSRLHGGTPSSSEWISPCVRVARPCRCEPISSMLSSCSTAPSPSMNTSSAPTNSRTSVAVDDEIVVVATAPARALLVGGEPFEARPLMWWNFVARDREEIDTAYAAWQSRSERFGHVDSDLARIEAPRPPWIGEG